MKPPTGERFDAALDLFHDHQWQAYKPQLGEDQLAELLVVLRPWFEEEFARSRSRVPNRKPAKVDKGSQSEGRTLVYARSGRQCEIAVPELCMGRASQWHHRKDRQQGGTWHASNGLDACPPCHLHVTSGERAEAKRFGWAVEPWREPCEVPVFRRGEWVYLDDEGFWSDVNAVVGGGFSAVETNEVETT